LKSNLRSEFDLIKKIRASAKRVPPSLLRCIGDDCAVFDPSFAESLAVSTDLLIEDVHFRRDWINSYFLGRKSLLVNLSDLAAMGTRPYACLLSLGLPGSLVGEYFESFITGFLEECDHFEIPLIGGDLSRSNNVVVSVTVVGYVDSGVPVYRSGAKEDDLIVLVGNVGLSGLGLRLIQERSATQLKRIADLEALERWADGADRYRWLLAHFLPEIHLATAMWLQGQRLANSMIDVSDGLGCDLLHILEESGCSGEIRVSDIPLPPGVEQITGASRELVLDGGEDYALLFTCSQEQFECLERSYPASYPSYSVIGRIFAGEAELHLVSESGSEVYHRKGFDHFS
jgi:thiamine-monophosphate kinase